jgi:two-component system, chemotaxis family, CheB/CheR fusion protein
MTVILPLFKSADVSLPIDSPKIPPINTIVPNGTITLSGLRVLVVEDDAALRQLLKTIIEEYEAIVTAAASAREAISMLTENPGAYDVLLSDFSMPHENGYALIQQVRALSPECGGQIPAAVLSGYVSAQQQEESLAVGFQKHITKPVVPDQLALIIAELALSE